MKLLVIALAISAVCFAQTTPPTLSALTALTGPSSTCTFESQDAAGGLYVNCTAADGTLQISNIVLPVDTGTLFGYAEIACLYWIESPGKFRLQCGLSGTTKAIDGYVPPVTRKKRWFLVWR
jgi:hypothetical protein